MTEDNAPAMATYRLNNLNTEKEKSCNNI
jgi:hypothetical protein